MKPHSPALFHLTQRTFLATGLALLTGISQIASATIPTVSSQNRQNSLQQKLIADRDDKKERDEVRVVRLDLNRAKNMARQAAEEANGGIRAYRAEDSMHGPAANCPYIDNGDSWTFTFLGGRPGSALNTIESVVTVYKSTSRVVMVYNGSVRTVQQTQFLNFTSDQRTVLVDLLRGNCGCNYLLTNSLRSQIIGQARSLPPGIQKQLLRGKGLPPGQAKKLVYLPKQVNTYLKVPSQYDLVVLGSNLLLLDQTRYTVIDLITNVL